MKSEPLTAKELIEALKEYPDDLPVFAYWEGLLIPITKENIESKGNYLELYVDQE